MKYTLFGHSFVMRVAGGAGGVKVEVGKEEYHIHCLGEGGLNFQRISQGSQKYLSRIKNSDPDFLIIDMGTNDLTKERPEAVACRLWSFIDALQNKPSGIFILPVLARTRSYARAAVSRLCLCLGTRQFPDRPRPQSRRGASDSARDGAVRPLLTANYQFLP